MQIRKILSSINLTGFIGMIVVNALANALPINGKTTGEISSQFPNLLVPAGFTFSVWGVIYLLLFIYIIFQLVVGFKGSRSPAIFINHIGILFFISCLANLSWILAWHYGMVMVSLLIIIILFGSLLAIYIRLKIGISDTTPGIRYMVHLPFSIYLGWITIAMMVNFAVVLVNNGWNRFGLSELFWALALLVAGTVVTLLIILRRKDIFYGLVVAWAFFGIWACHSFHGVSSVPEAIIGTVVLLLLSLILVTIVIQIIRKKVY